MLRNSQKEYRHYQSERCFRDALEAAQTLTISDMEHWIRAFNRIIERRRIRREEHREQAGPQRIPKAQSRLIASQIQLTDIVERKAGD